MENDLKIYLSIDRLGEYTLAKVSACLALPSEGRTTPWMMRNRSLISQWKSLERPKSNHFENDFIPVKNATHKIVNAIIEKLVLKMFQQNVPSTMIYIEKITLQKTTIGRMQNNGIELNGKAVVGLFIHESRTDED